MLSVQFHDKIRKKSLNIFVFLSYWKNFVGTEKRVRIIHGNRAIRVRAIEVILYFQCRLRSAWASAKSDESSLCTQQVAKDPSILDADSKLWSDWGDAQADPSPHWVYMPFCWFCHTLAHICTGEPKSESRVVWLVYMKTYVVYMYLAIIAVRNDSNLVLIFVFLCIHLFVCCYLFIFCGVNKKI